MQNTRTPQAGNRRNRKPDGQFALVFAADEGFARATAVAMHSALRHLAPSTEPELYVLDNGITEGSRERLRKLAFATAGREIRWIEVPPERLGGLRDESHLTATTYSRLLIPELLPTNIQRAVYLDGDLIVREDLSPLFRVELGGAPLAAVRDFAEARPYFNAGVLAIDVGQWRTEGFADRALGFANSATEPLLWADQDAMNTVTEDWYELDFRWNVQLSMYFEELPETDLTNWLSQNRAALYRDAAILHFAGRPKPWHPWSRTASPGKTLWARALLRSGWYKPMEALGWLLPWLGRRALDAGRRAISHGDARQKG